MSEHENEPAEAQSQQPATPLPGQPIGSTLHIAGTTGQPVLGNLYEAVGGSATFKLIVEEFYKGVATDELLRPMYPEGDLTPAAHRLQLFLEQYWGGPKTYQEERGHPRLRMRHAAFVVNPEARDRWLLHMRAGVEAAKLPPLLEAELWAYLERAAHSLLNSFE
jgi:hemoglobin